MGEVGHARGGIILELSKLLIKPPLRARLSQLCSARAVPHEADRKFLSQCCHRASPGTIPGFLISSGDFLFTP